MILTPVLRDRVIHFNNFLAQIYFQLFIFNFLLDILDNIFYNGNIAEKLFPSTAIQVSHISDHGWLCLLLFYEPWISLDAFNFLPLVMHVFFLLIYFRWMMSLKSNYLSLVTWFSFVIFIFLIWTTTGLQIISKLVISALWPISPYYTLGNAILICKRQQQVCLYFSH